MSYGLMAFAAAESDLQLYFEQHADLIEELDEESVASFLYEFKDAIKRVKSLDNSEFYPCPYEMPENVDKALAELGAPQLRIAGGLLGNHFPINLPYPADFPMYGYWTSDLILASHQTLKDAVYTGGDDFVKRAVD